MIQIGDFERGGVVLDSDPFSLQSNEWSDCRNVRFDNRSVSKITGEETLIATSNRPNELIYWQQPGANVDRYIYVDENGIVRTKLVADSTDNALNSTSLTSTERFDLNLFLGGSTLIVNAFDVRPMVNGVANDGSPYYITSPDVTTVPLTSLQRASTGWLESGFVTGAVNISAKVVRPFKQVLFAANLEYTDTNGLKTFGPSTIRISNVPAANALIPTWTLSDSTVRNKASDFQLSTNSAIVDMVPFQNSMAIYTTDSIWTVDVPSSTTAPATVRLSSSGRGMLAKNCAVEFYGQHFVVGNEDIYTYAGGSTIKSVADEKIRDYFFDNVNRSQLDLVKVIHYRKQSEIWISYPKGTSATINEKLIYNYDHGTWTVADAFGASGVTVGAPIVDNVYDNTQEEIIYADATNNELVIANRGTSYRTEAIDAFVERRGFDIAPSNPNIKKWMDSIYYIIRGSGNVIVQAKSTDTPGRPVDFTDTSNNPRDKYLKNRTFSLDADMGDYKVDPRTNGRYYNTKIGTNDITSSWTLIRYILSFSVDDER